MTQTGLLLFGGRTEYPAIRQEQTVQDDVLDLANVVYITVQPRVYVAMLNQFEDWFLDREEVEIVDYGTSDKRGLGFIVIEWFEAEIDQLFLDILNTEDAVLDYTVYSREADE